MTGAIGTNWFDTRGADGGVPLAPAFLGTRTITLEGSARNVVFQDPTLQPAAAAALGAFTAQDAIQQNRSLAWNVAANYVVDAGVGPPGQMDNCIRCGVANLNITLPSAAANPGREIKIIDVSGGVGGNAFNIVPGLPVDSIGPLVAGTTRTVTQVEAKCVILKCMSATGALRWDIIASTTLV